MQEQDERIMAGLSHITILLPFMGIIGPIIIWVTQREKSEFVAFQALQAAAYQLLLIALWVVGIGCYMITAFASFGTTIISAPSEPNAVNILGFLLPFLVFGAIFLVGIAYVVYGIVGAVQSLRGQQFRYLLIGRWVAHFLDRQQP